MNFFHEKCGVLTRFSRQNIAALALSVTVLSACGGGGEGILTCPGPSTAGPSNLVLYVNQAQGHKIEAYRVRADGLLPAEAFSSIDVEDPRNILLVGNVLYVATQSQVLSIRLASDGSFPAAATGETTALTNSAPTDMVVSNGILYVAAEGQRVVIAYELDGNGDVSSDVFASGGDAISNYVSLAIDEPNGFLYAGASGKAMVDAYEISGTGEIGPDPLEQDVTTTIITPDKILINDSTMYVVEREILRIVGFHLDGTGMLPEEPVFQTRGVGRYAHMVIQDDMLYATAQKLGRIDVYELDPGDGSFVDENPIFSTEEDAFTQPIGIGLTNSMMYIAQSGLDRIDSYPLDGSSLPSMLPNSCTDTSAGARFGAMQMGTFAP